MTEKRTLMLSAKGVQFVREVGEGATLHEVFRGMFKEMFRKGHAFGDLLEELGFVQRVGVKEDTVKLPERGQHVLPETMHQSDITAGIPPLQQPGARS